MTSSTRAPFRDRALLSGLVSEADLDRAEQAVRDQAGDEDGLLEITDAELADQLVKLNVLTSYQSAQLSDGRTKLHLGPYIITDFIGQGGMGQVFKAEHDVMGRECAVKVLPLHKSTPETISNFKREIRTQARLDHPNLVQAYDAGRDGDVHYLVTEYVPGTDLRRLVRSRGKLDIPEAASIIMQAALALHYAHERELIHRDVKPGNVLVTPDGVAKVSDLGMANFVSDDGDDPRAGKIVGTADYLAPEQIMNPHDIRKVSDIYSLGCTLYYAVTGKVPFPGGTPKMKARRHLDEIPWHPRRFNPDISEEFVEIIADMMEKEPDSRIQSAAEAVSRLESWASDVAPIPSQGLTKVRWAPPPLPTEEAQDTDSSDVEDLVQESVGEDVQPTDGLSSQETSSTPVPSVPAPPPLPVGQAVQQPSAENGGWLLALIVASVISLMFGISIGVAVSGWF